MKDKQIENIYYTLIGQMQEEFCVPGIENLFVDGSECDLAYHEMLEAYERLKNRLGIQNEDADIEIIINSLFKIQRLVAFKMFEYGKKM